MLLDAAAIDVVIISPQRAIRRHATLEMPIRCLFAQQTPFFRLMLLIASLMRDDISSRRCRALLPLMLPMPRFRLPLICRYFFFFSCSRREYASRCYAIAADVTIFSLTVFAPPYAAD